MNRKSIIIYIGFLLPATHQSSLAYSQETTTSSVEQQLENLTDADQSETEDDSYLQQMQQFLKNPININTASSDELRELKIISDLQIDNLIAYIKAYIKKRSSKTS